MKKNNIFKISILIIIGIFLLSYILPVETSTGTTKEFASIWGVFTYISVALSYFGNTGLYVLLVGALYAVLNLTGVYSTFVDSIATKFKNKPIIFVISVFIIMTLLSSLLGLKAELFIIIPLIISILMKLKYTKLVALGTTFGAILIGGVSGVFSYKTIGVITQALSLNIMDNVLIRVIILVLSLVIGIIFLVLYDKNKAKKEVVEDKLEDMFIVEVKTKKGSKNSIVAISVIFGIIVLLLVVAGTSWVQVFKIDIFTKFFEFVSTIKIGNFPILDSVVGLPAIGNFGINEFIVIILILIIVIKFVYKIKIDDLLEASIEGMKKVIKPAIMVVLISLVLIMATYHPAYTFITGALGNLLNGFNLFIVSLITIISSFFNMDLGYGIQSIMTAVGNNITNPELLKLTSTVITSFYGLTMIIAPTSLVLVLGLSYLDINYTKWVKYIWKTLVTLLIVVLIVLMIVSLI